jgi:site-specific DNA-methyltransferase (adenine-specific)/adenine-specific DNA-methyltransferase
MTKQQKEYIIKLLQEGKELPEDFKYLLFPTKQKEYELAYAGKMRKEDLLANEDGVFPVPLQVEKVFNGNEYESFDDGWKNIIAFGDNLQFLKTIYENKDPLIKDKVKGKVKLIYIDPPFATTDEFQNKEGAKAYNDKKKGAEFVEFLRKRLIVAREILADDGSIFVHLDQKMSHYIKILMDEIFGKNQFQNEVIWHYQAGTAPKKGFAKKHDNIFFYVKKSGQNIFNTIRLLVKDESIYPKIDENGRKYRMSGNNNATKYYADEGRKADDIWTWLDRKENNIVQVFHALPEHLDYPTQKPEKLICRIIEASTNKGDIVLDFFGGSGTTMAVAEKLGRKWITCDLGKLSYFTMQKRILQVQNSKDLEDPKKKYGKKAKSFITASLGSYDLEKTFELERKQYLEFVSGLFEIELKKYKVSGFEFDGKKDNYPVIIYDYKKYKNSTIDENYLNDLHRNIGKKVGSRVYIVAPINYIDFVDDFVEIDDVRYYFLKIPYHIINELHKKPFVKVRQPQSKSRVNDIEEAIGFHFKRPPEVKAEVIKEKEEIKIIIKSFKSSELLSDKTKNEKQKEDFENLSAVFIDKTYNGKAFEMDEALFVDELLPKKKKKQSTEDFEKELKELSKNGVEIVLKSKEVGDKIMVVFTDIYGNDFTQTFTIN